MLTYTNRLPRLTLPEYGRNIQRMVDHCVTIENREERTLCANTIVNAMNTLFPAQGDNQAEHMRKLWDHLFIMSGFNLDVDVPFEHVQSDVFADRPDNIPIARPEHMPMRRYGRNIARMIDVACGMEPGEERDSLVFLIADHMKKIVVAFDREGVDDRRVFDDLRMLSHGMLALDPEHTTLHEFRALPAPSKKKKKK